MSVFYHIIKEHYDINFRSLEFSVAEISAMLLVYPLHLSVIFLQYLKIFLIFEPSVIQLFYISFYMIIEHCHSNHLIPIKAI